MATWLHSLGELAFVLLMLIKMTVLLGIGWLLHFALARRNPRWHVLLWRLVMAGLVLLAPVELLLPHFSVAVLPAPVQSLQSPWMETMSELIPPPAMSNGPASLPVIDSGATLSPAVVLQTKPAMRNWNLSQLLWLVWLLVACVLAFRLLYSLYSLRGVIRKTQPAPEPIAALAREIAARAGLRRVPAVCLAFTLASPFVARAFTPLVILPGAILEKGNQTDLKAILAHEFTHIRFRDLAWMMFAKWITIVLWFHPLAWALRRTHAMACEEVCDGVAAEFAGGAPVYSQTLARTFIEMVVDAPQPLGVPLIRASEITRRIQRLRAGITVKALRRQWVALVLGVAVILISGLGCIRLAFAENKAATSEPQIFNSATTPLPSSGEDYTMDEILAGIAAHEAQIQSAEFDLKMEILPSDHHPRIRAHVTMMEAHYVWDSSFNITINSRQRHFDEYNLDSDGKEKVLPFWSEDRSWDHKQMVAVKKVDSKTTEAFINGPEWVWANFYGSMTPMYALGYMVIDDEKEDLSLSKVLTKYGVIQANPSTEIVDDKKTYVVETSFASAPANPLDGEEGKRAIKIRFYICPELQFSPLKIEYLKETEPYRSYTIEYATIDGIVFPAITRANYPGIIKNKGREILPPCEYRYANVRLNSSSPEPVEIPNGVIVYDGIAGMCYEKGNEKASSRPWNPRYGFSKAP